MSGSERMLKALQFHRITKSFQFCGTWNTPQQLDLFIDTIYKYGYEIVLPGGKRNGIIITFDDGEENLYKYAFPILKKYRCPAIVFLIGSYIGRKNYWDISVTGKRNQHLNWKQIIEMKEVGIDFGSHTMSHRNLTLLNGPELEYEISESKRILEKQLGRVNSISYPFNRVNDRVKDAVKKAGYRYGFGGDGRDDFSIKKEAVYITDNSLTIRVKISEKPALCYAYERMQQKIINFFTIATILNRKK